MTTVRLHKVGSHADPTDNESVRQIMKGTALAHGKPRKQARPLTAEALGAVKATAGNPSPFGGNGKGRESTQRTSWRVRVDVALLATLREGVLRRPKAAALAWDNGSELITVRRSWADQEAEGVVLYAGREAAQALSKSGVQMPDLIPAGR